jgi:sulfur relay (sulfurtransferase) DsrC/TusE family protein
MATAEHLVDAWTPEIAERAAAALGIWLGPTHWQLIGCARELWASRGRMPELRTLARTTGLSLEAIERLFPDPERSLSRVAGTREP